MALLIQKRDSSLSLYIRLECTLHVTGKIIIVRCLMFSDRDSYMLNKKIYVERIPNFIRLDYNREIDGNDILSFSHNKVLEYLTSEHYIEEDINDPDTGEIVKKTTYIPAFCNSEEIIISEI